MRRKVFVVVLNWNRPDDTLGCLDSLSKLILDDIDLTVVVVDNASSDDSVERIKKFKGSFKLCVLENSENLGFAEGNNIGIDYSLREELIM